MLKQPRQQSAWLVVGALLLGVTSANAAPTVFGERASVKVRPNYVAHEDTGVKLVTGRNEYASFQVVIHGGTAGAHVTSAEISDFSGPSTLSHKKAVVYREALLNVTTVSGGVGDKGMWPDGLVPDVDETVGEKRNAFPFDVPANQARALWVDLLVPQDTAPGDYQGTVKVSGQGFTAQVPVGISVMNVALPSTSSLSSAFLVSSNAVCTAMTGNAQCNGDLSAMSQEVVPFEKMALDHRITLPNILLVGRDGNDWPSFDSAYSPYLDGTASTHLFGARMTSAQISARRPSVSDATALDQGPIKAWGQHFKDKGWMDRLFDYTADEPPYGTTWAIAKSRLQSVRAADPDIRTLVTTNITWANQNGLSDLVDVMTPVVNFMDGTTGPFIGNQRPKYDAYLQKGNALWMYQSCMSQGCGYGTNQPENTPGSGWPSYMVDRSAAKNRAMQWLVYKYAASGELYYETASMLSTAWTNQLGYSGNGDGTLFYPGTPQAIGGQTRIPLPSIRLKQIRLGMQDYEWLKLVADAGDPKFSQQVVDNLLPNAHSVPDDGEAFDKARLSLIGRYAQLTGEAVPPVVSNTLDGQNGSSSSTGVSTHTAGSCSSAGNGLVPVASALAMAAWLGRRKRKWARVT